MRISIALAVLLVALAASAQAPSTIPLGPDRAVQAQSVWCGSGSGVPMRCAAWQPIGFAFPAGPLAPQLTFARTWAVVPTTNRILVALSNASGPFLYTGFAVRMMRSDDRGATFVPVTWRWLETVALMAFVPGTDDGVAAGDSGYVWTTDDGGDTWRDRGSNAGTTFTELAVVRGETVLVDASGNVWRMSGSSFARDLILTDTSAHVRSEGDAILVTTTGEEVRIRYGHGVDRHHR